MNSLPHSATIFIIACALASAAAEERPDYVAHEWGTFTSVQGADGVQMEWNPLVLWELPQFVYEVNRVRSRKPAAPASKLGMQCRQRMETPVIYFYSDHELTVSATVEFPLGSITEWYPLESAGDLSARLRGEKAKRPALEWPELKLIPLESAAGKDLAKRLPEDAGGSHYYAARKTDAALVQVTPAGGKPEVEKFLFYRGVGDFQAPLTVTLEEAQSNAVKLVNTGAEKLKGVMLCEIRGGVGRMIPLGELNAAESRNCPLPIEEGYLPLPELQGKLAHAMEVSLTEAGLFPREAAAMVATWDTAWFGESGLRILYVLPRSWADRTLPLQLKPQPREVHRVMVGRAEVVTPAMEKALGAQVNRYIAASEKDRPAVVTATQELGLGRFTEAVLRRLISQSEHDQNFYALSWQLLQAASAPAPKAIAN